MLASPNLEVLLSIASFALATAGIVVRFFFPAGPAKQTLLAALLIFIMLASGTLLRESWEVDRQIRTAADDMVRIIGNEKRTLEDILVGLRQPNYNTASAALDLLIEEERVGSEAIMVADDSEGEIRVRLYFVRTF